MNILLQQNETHARPKIPSRNIYAARRRGYLLTMRLGKGEFDPHIK